MREHTPEPEPEPEPEQHRPLQTPSPTPSCLRHQPSGPTSCPASCTTRAHKRQVSCPCVHPSLLCGLGAGGLSPGPSLTPRAEGVVGSLQPFQPAHSSMHWGVRAERARVPRQDLQGHCRTARSGPAVHPVTTAKLGVGSGGYCWGVGGWGPASVYLLDPSNSMQAPNLHTPLIQPKLCCGGLTADPELPQVGSAHNQPLLLFQLLLEALTAHPIPIRIHSSSLPSSSNKRGFLPSPCFQATSAPVETVSGQLARAALLFSLSARHCQGCTVNGTGD